MTLFTRYSGSSQCLETEEGAAVGVPQGIHYTLLPRPFFTSSCQLFRSAQSFMPTLLPLFFVPLFIIFMQFIVLYLTVTNNFIWYKKYLFFIAVLDMLTSSLHWTWLVLRDWILLLYLLLADITCPSATPCAELQQCSWCPYTLVSRWVALCQPSTYPLSMALASHHLIVVWLSETFIILSLP